MLLQKLVQPIIYKSKMFEEKLVIQIEKYTVDTKLFSYISNQRLSNQRELDRHVSIFFRVSFSTYYVSVKCKVSEIMCSKESKKCLYICRYVTQMQLFCQKVVILSNMSYFYLFNKQACSLILFKKKIHPTCSYLRAFYRQAAPKFAYSFINFVEIIPVCSFILAYSFIRKLRLTEYLCQTKIILHRQFEIITNWVRFPSPGKISRNQCQKL